MLTVKLFSCPKGVTLSGKDCIVQPGKKGLKGGFYEYYEVSMIAYSPDLKDLSYCLFIICTSAWIKLHCTNFRLSYLKILESFISLPYTLCLRNHLERLRVLASGRARGTRNLQTLCETYRTVPCTISTMNHLKLESFNKVTHQVVPKLSIRGRYGFFIGPESRVWVQPHVSPTSCSKKRM